RPPQPTLFPYTTLFRSFHLQRLVAAYAPHPVAGRAGVGNFLARTVAGRAVLLDAEEALLHAHDARAITGVTGAGARAGLGAAAMADIAGLPARHADLGVETVGRLLQRDVQCVLEIGSAIHLRPAPSAAGTKDLAKDVAKGVRETTGAAHACAHPRIGIDSGMTEAVVSRPFLGVGQHFVGFLDFLEFLFGFLAVRVAIRVVLHRQFAISLLELIVGGVFRYPQNLVVIAFCHLSCLRL